MTALRHLSGILLAIAITWSAGALWGCNDARPLACDAVDLMMTEGFMGAVLLIVIVFIVAIIIENRG